MATPHNIPQLIGKKLQETASTEEEAELEAWAGAAPENRALLNQLLDEPTLFADVKSFDALWGEAGGADRFKRMERAVLLRTDRPKQTRKLAKWLPYAAAVAMILTVGLLVWGDRWLGSGKQIATTEILPGGNRATLTLVDGSLIDLSDEQEGIIVRSDDITYQDGSTLGLAPSSTLVLTTPKGGTYQVTLPDGSRVWLNAASTLKYPSRFSAEGRIVELTGEAYFEVVPQDHSPFSVQTENQVVNVLGTSFNISAYPEDPDTRTTLVEGKVRVESNGASLQLVPGEQGKSTAGVLAKSEVNTEQYTSWRNGLFDFSGKTLHELMPELARWYDIEVAYEGAIRPTRYVGKIFRNNNLSEVLNILETAKVVYRLEGRKLTIINN